MARYIDAGKLLKELTISPYGTKIPDVDCDNFPVKIDLRILRRIILRQPTADVVEVVRCHECKSYNGHRYCEYFASTVFDNDFCSYGERKDE